MNDFLKIVFATCAVIGLIGANAWLFNRFFELDMDYLFVAVITVFFMTALEVTIFRVITGKLKVKLTFE